MKIVTIIGARPQFIKAAALSRELRNDHTEILVHTGQHYDQNMSEIFFQELSIPTPDYNLGVGSGSHAKQTAQMLTGIEGILVEEKPDALLVYGDTNSTLAGALAASKILIPIIHVEAGLRSFNMNMPEEQNRILTDRLASYLFCPTDMAVSHLKNEGITKNIYNVGDVMCDAVVFYSKQMIKHTRKYFFDRLTGLFGKILPVNNWYMATIHRAENTDSIQKIKEFLLAFEEFDFPVLFPVHPRTKKMVEQLHNELNFKNTLFVEPVGYLDMLFFVKNSVKCITDSGGLQKEAYILNTPCVTVRNQTEWVETLIGNNNILSNPTKTDILDKVFQTVIDKTIKNSFYGTGQASRQICDIIRRG